MFGKYTIAELGALLSDPSRVEILTHLLDGSRHSAGALAIAAGLSPQAASAHLTKLTRGGLLRVTRDGRLKLFELSRPEIGHLLEALGAATHATPQGGNGAASHDAVRLARTCYDHMAGQIAILLTRSWVERGILRGPGIALELTPVGERWFADRGIDVFTLRCQRRTFLRGCLDWTERQPHVGGALGAAWLSHCLSAGWVTRMKGSRAVRVSEVGRGALQDLLGCEIPLVVPARAR
jgi:DNA-binding transcriptional ArsR family regulator